MVHAFFLRMLTRDLIAMVDSSLEEMTARAVSQLPWARRRIAQRVIAKHADAFYENLSAKLSEHPECSEMNLLANSERFNSSTMFSIDPDKLQKWIELILKILPLIIALF